MNPGRKNNICKRGHKVLGLNRGPETGVESVLTLQTKGGYQIQGIESATGKLREIKDFARCEEKFTRRYR